MIDFACKQFKLKDVIKCGLGLTKAELEMMLFFMQDCCDGYSTDKLAEKLKFELSTVQRAVKKLYEKGIIQRKQKNLENGGYVYVYSSVPKKAVRKIILEVVHKWVERVDEELSKW